MSQWYRTGSVNVINGSATVAGNGTVWGGANAHAGDVFIGPDDKLYEIVSVDSPSQLTIKPIFSNLTGYQGASDTTGTAKYAIAPLVGSTTTAELAQRVSALLTSWQERQDELSDWQGGVANGGPNGDGKYPLTDSIGNTVNVSCPAVVSQGLADLNTAVTSASTSASTATTKASQASTSASQAATSASNAATSATSAGNSASAAATSASTATTKATEASNSATSASTSASTATTKASEASTSATNAASSATAAASSAAQAATPATLTVNTDALVVNASKRVLVGTTTDDTVNQVQVNGTAVYQNAKIGNSAIGAGYARFGHKGFDASSNYGYLQYSDGRLFMEGPTIILSGQAQITGKALIGTNVDVTGALLQVNGGISCTGGMAFNGSNSAVPLLNQYDIRLAAVNNTSLQIQMRGTDGVIRVATITLS